MKRVYVNEEWCLGCHLCEYYCAFAETGKDNMALALKHQTIRPRIHVEEQGQVHFAVSCRHCEDPICVKSCLTGALSVEDGVIRINSDRCIHCYTCILACPYGAIVPSDSGAVKKCELCVNTATGLPNCVQGCPNGAIVFEDSEERKVSV
ncbi:4Fe-4S dicluster domain-containing protein [Ruminococcus sp.]|uniref:4Fe-4S dicluster domain-containing protein n=1 Tax=Ruminococcus sp. TaxID=41978 RepID=UPI0025F9B2E0|nr:4Fe-4S dicluster domain-containing protein [Ruminococcus sp.]MCI5816185.1 4Fe-4S binding protein [Ruminococcus sp.]MDD7556763.1 4Fe-4S binding protein [Ruminococcus sp.]MDY4964423.1 4Fe-4S dicluster domain-containing protein [Ruminococcus callidus]